MMIGEFSSHDKTWQIDLPFMKPLGIKTVYQVQMVLIHKIVIKVHEMAELVLLKFQEWLIPTQATNYSQSTIKWF